MCLMTPSEYDSTFVQAISKFDIDSWPSGLCLSEYVAYLYMYICRAMVVVVTACCCHTIDLCRLGCDGSLAAGGDVGILCWLL